MHVKNAPGWARSATIQHKACKALPGQTTNGEVWNVSSVASFSSYAKGFVCGSGVPGGGVAPWVACAKGILAVCAALRKRFAGDGDCALEFSAKKFLGRQLREILGDADVLLVQHQILDVLRVAFGAEDEPDGRFLAGLALVAVEIPKIKPHLPFVFRLESAELQVDDDEPPEGSVEEQQIHLVVRRVDRDAPLPTEKGEVGPEFLDRRLDLREDRVLQIAFGIVVPQARQGEEVTASEDEIGRQFPSLADLGEFRPDDGLGLAGDRRSLEQHGVDLLFHAAGAPVFVGRHLQVEHPLQLVVDPHQRADMRPAQLCTQRVHDLGLGESVRDAYTMLDGPEAPSGTELAREKRGAFLDGFLSIGAPAALEDVLLDPAADLPVQGNGFGIDRDGDTLARRTDEVAQVGKQAAGKCVRGRWRNDPRRRSGRLRTAPPNNVFRLRLSGLSSHKKEIVSVWQYRQFAKGFVRGSGVPGGGVAPWVA